MILPDHRIRALGDDLISPFKHFYDDCALLRQAIKYLEGS